jgi:hypothetical protein
MPTEKEGGFLSLVWGNNLTLNDYIRMNSNGVYNEFAEAEEDDTEIDEYRGNKRDDIDIVACGKESAN